MLYGWLQIHSLHLIFQGLQIRRKNTLSTQNKPLSCNCSNIHAFTKCKKVMIGTTKFVLIKGFTQSLSVSPWGGGVKLVAKTYQLRQLPGQGGWHQTRSMVFHCRDPHRELWHWLRQLPATLLEIPLFICMWDWLHFVAQHHVVKDKAKSSDLFFRSLDAESASISVPLPSPGLYQSAKFYVSVASACRTAWKQNSDQFDSCSCGQSHVDCYGRSQAWGYQNSVVIRRVCTESYSRCERQKLDL